MASSEIEVVSSEPKTQKNPAEMPVLDVFSASAYGDFQKLRKFVEQDGASLSKPDVHGYYALHWAALNNFPDIAHYIIQHGGDVSATNMYSRQHCIGQLCTVQLRRRMCSCRMELGLRQLMYMATGAAYKGFADTVRLLLFRDACQGRQDKEGCTPLHWAALRGNVEACTVLVYAGSKKELMVKDNAGFTPVQIASDKG